MPIQKLLYLGQYNLDRLDVAPKIRTWQLYQELKKQVDVDFITGLRRERRWPLLKYLLSGRLKEVDAIYLEAATSTSMETDLLLLGVACLRGLPIGIYIRDAYPMFDMVDTRTLKHKLLVWAWYVSLWFYRLTARVLYYQSESFAQFFQPLGKEACLPPGGRDVPFEPLDPESTHYLYAGGLSEICGVTELLEAMSEVHRREPRIKLILVCHQEELHFLGADYAAPWLEIKHLDYNQIIELRHQIYATIMPRKKNVYADAVVAVKLWDYMSLGRPVVCTNCTEMSRIVENHQAGVVAEFTPADLAEKIIWLFHHKQAAAEMARRAYDFIQTEALWRHRASQILADLDPARA